MLKSAPECPPLAAHVWGWFLELNSERGSNGMEAGRITSQMMRDWCWATGNKLELWERKAIRRLDDVFMRSLKND